MKRLLTHKVLSVGLSIYITLLSLGVYYVVQQVADPSSGKVAIIQVLPEVDSPERDGGPSTLGKRTLNSNALFEEDDDDTAKVLLHGLKIKAFDLSSLLSSLHSSYLLVPKDISTPPPRC